MDRRTAKERLREQRDELSSALAAVSERLAISQSESGGELSLSDQHPADAATETMQRELDLTHQRRFEAKLARVDAALARVDAGTYGTCTVCGSKIPDERLEILPETPFCVKDAAKEEREV